MDFRWLLLALSLFIPHVFASPMKDMDELVPMVYQYPAQASQKIELLDSTHYSFREKLRLQLIRCELLNQNGDGQAAINLAQLSIAQAKSNQLEEALPYFYICMADGYSSVGQFTHTFTLLDDAISQAKKSSQLQALVNALRTRAQFDTEFEDFSSAIEDLRLAIDLLPQQFNQDFNWFWAPETYVYVTMANMFISSNELKSSLKYIDIALQANDAEGTVKHYALLSAARIYFNAGKIIQSQKWLSQAKNSALELNSQHELAVSDAIIASLEFNFGNLEDAEALIINAKKVFDQNYKVVHSLRSNRLLASIKFEQNNDKEALKLLREAIDKGEQLHQYTDLQTMYHTLETFYISKGNPQKAYENLKLAYEAGNQANKELNSARFIQYKARLDRQASINSQQKQLISTKDQPQPESYRALKLVFFVFGMLGICIFFVIIQTKRQAKRERALAQQELPINQELNQLLISAKKQSSPLSLLLVHIEKLDLPQFETLQQGIDDVVRESDIVTQYSSSELLVILPNTTNAGAQKVVANLYRHIKQVTHRDHIFGMASMQQFDQIDQLIKRANFDRLTQLKNREIRTSKFDDVQAANK